MKKLLLFFKQTHPVSTITVSLLILITFFVSFVWAAPPGSPYNPGETLTPTCSPGDANCTVVTPAVSGANSDITSLTGLTTALSLDQGGTGMSTIATNKLLYTSALDTLAELGLDTTLSIVAGVLGVPDGSITEPKLDVLDLPADGEVLSWNNAGSQFEWIVAGGGGTASAIWDADSDTGIQAEEAADEDILRFDTGGVERIRIESDGKMYWPAGDGGNVVWNPVGAGDFRKVGGDEFWALAEESSFQGIVDTNYIYVNGNHGGVWPSFVVQNTEVAQLNKDSLIELRSQDGSIRHKFSAANNVADADYAMYTVGDPVGYRIEIDARIGEAKVVGGDNWWSLGEEIFLNSYYGEMGSPGDGLVMWWNSAPTDRRVTIDHLLKLTPTDAPGTCNAGAEGDIYFDDSLSKPCYCDGANWQQIDGAGVC